MSKAESIDKLIGTVKELVKEIRELRLSMVNVRVRWLDNMHHRRGSNS
jgi:hypothetical protein